MNPSFDYREDIIQCLDVLKKGGIILYPTDTIWGIGCDATNAEAVERIYRIKKRSDTKSMLVLLDNENRLPSYIEQVSEVAWNLIELSDKPLTIVFSGAKNLARNLIAPDGSIGIRITREEFTSELISRFRKPIVSTSANISGEASPAVFSRISAEILESVDYTVNYRQDDYHEYAPSSIIRLGTGGEIEILRK